MENKSQDKVATVNDRIAKATGYTPEQVAIIKNTVAKGATDLELAYFLNVAKSVELNPFNREIWAYKDTKGNLLVFAGRDGFLKRAQESQLWNGLTSFAVHANDDFNIDIKDGQVKIMHRPDFTNPGDLIGAYAVSKPKGAEYPTIEYVKFATYNKGQFVWKSYPEDMIKKVAEIHCLKKAYGITVLQSEYDYKIESDTAHALDAAKSELDALKEKIVDGIDKYKGEDKEDIRTMCQEKQREGSFDLDFARQTASILGVEL